MINKDKTKHVVSRMQIDQGFRKEVCLRNHYWFFLAYFTRHIKYPCADMHKQMLYFSGISWVKKMVVLGFPQCGKSLIHSYSLPLWSILNNKAKTVVIVVNGKAEKTQFRERFAKELMFNQKLLQDFGLNHRKSGYYFFFPQYQSQVCVVDLQTEADIDLVVGSTPDLIVIDAIKPYAEDESELILKQVCNIFTEAGTKDTRKILVGRGDGAHGPLIKFTTEMIEKKDKTFLPAFYPFIKNDDEEPAWLGKFQEESLIEKEFSRSMTKEEFFFQYFLLAKIPDIPFRITEDCRNNLYPLDRNDWEDKLTDEQKHDIAELVFVPYQGERDQAVLLWGVKQSNQRFVLQGIEWQGDADEFDITDLANETRVWLDTMNPEAKVSLYGDLRDNFSHRVCRTTLDFKGQIITNCQRKNSEERKKLVKHFTAGGTIGLQADFADLVFTESSPQKGFQNNWFNHLALVLNASASGSVILTTVK